MKRRKGKRGKTTTTRKNVVFHNAQKAMDIEDFLKDAYKNISDSNDCSLRENNYFSIIQIKNEQRKLVNYGNSLYVDIKNFIENYILSVKDLNKGRGYDVPDLSKIMTVVDTIEAWDERWDILRFTFRELKEHGFEDYADELKHKSKKIYIEARWNDGNIKGKIIAIFSVCFYNIWTCLGVMLIFAIVNCVFTLPLASEDSAWFTISYMDYADSNAANHILNFICEIIGLNDPPFCKPTGVAGIISIIVNKILWLFILSGVFSKYAAKYFNVKVTDYD